jgi:hypothetical protein
VSPASRLAIGCHDKQSRVETEEAEAGLSQHTTGLLDHALTREDVDDIRPFPFYFRVVSQATPRPRETSHVLDHRLELVNDIDSSHGPQMHLTIALEAVQKVAKFPSWFSPPSWTTVRNWVPWCTVTSHQPPGATSPSLIAAWGGRQ